jgi:hypothetical protein
MRRVSVDSLDVKRVESLYADFEPSTRSGNLGCGSQLQAVPLLRVACVLVLSAYPTSSRARRS